MATSVSLNSTSYSIPATGETNWGTDVSNYLIALSTGVLSKAGGAFTLTADADFGANFGLKSIYYKSRGTVSTSGVVRLANAESIGWRNNANSANLLLTVNSSDQLVFNSNVVYGALLGTADQVLTTNTGATAQEWRTLVNANISSSAAISYSKLEDASALSVLGRASNSSGANASIAAGTDNYVLRRSGTTLGFGLLVNANIDASAAIAFSKLANGSALSVLGVTGNSSAANASIAAGTDGHVLRRSGTSLAFGLLVNANIDSAAAIAGTKIDPDFGSQNVETTGTGTFSGGLVGTTVDAAASSGHIGEYSLTTNSGGAVTPAASGSAKTVVSASIPSAGEWEIEGTVLLSPGTISGFTHIFATLSSSADSASTLGSNNAGTVRVAGFTGANNIVAVPRIIYRVTGSTTVYLNAILTYSSLGTASFTISASNITIRRVR